MYTLNVTSSWYFFSWSHCTSDARRLIVPLSVDEGAGKGGRSKALVASVAEMGAVKEASGDDTVLGCLTVIRRLPVRITAIGRRRLRRREAD